MQTLHLENSRLQLAIEPEAGASISAFALRHGGEWIPVLRPTPPEAIRAGNSSAMSSFLLVPFSNRLTGAQFSFQGEHYQLQANADGGYAIHGCVRKRPWTLEKQRSDHLQLSFRSTDFADLDFPFPFRAQIIYGLSNDTLTAELTVTNTGDKPMPAGAGFHPYFQRALFDPTEQVELEFSATGAYRDLSPEEAAQELRSEQRFHPMRPLPDRGFDTCFAGWNHRAKLRWPKSEVTGEIESDASLGHIILFTPPAEPFFALEPVSNANNGFNLLAKGLTDAGVKVLQSDEALVAGFRLRLC